MGLGMVDRDIEVGKEYKVGTFTVDGVTYDRYVKIVDCGAMPSNTTKPVAHGITNILGVLSLEGVMIRSSGTGNTWYVLPFCDGISLNDTIKVYVDPANINIEANTSWGSNYYVYVTLEYYK